MVLYFDLCLRISIPEVHRLHSRRNIVRNYAVTKLVQRLVARNPFGNSDTRSGRSARRAIKPFADDQCVNVKWKRPSSVSDQLRSS